MRTDSGLKSFHHVRQRIATRFRREGWTILQRSAAAVVAFIIALWLGDHQDVFFAPIAAVVAMNTDLGERGINALKLLLGVLVGVLVGEVALLIVENQVVVALGIAVLLAVALATLAGGSRLTTAELAATR